jgi:methionyl-tRNA synthetase
MTLAEQKDSPPHALDVKPEITIDVLNKVDLRVATVLHAEVVPRAKKLLKLDIDMGEKRTIVAGISESYSPEDLEGRQVIVVANLKPAKLMGILSNGMLLAAVGKDGSAVATLDKKVTPGTPLR